MPKKLTTEQYIQKANKVHNNKYDYSKTIYIRTSDQITIICSEHGQFSQYPFNHLKGHGCLKCSGKCKSTTERFIENAIEAHGEGVYDYSNSVYKNAKTKLDIRCTNCNTTFSMTPSDHIHGKNGCPAYAMSETKLETVMNNVCDQAEDEFNLLKMTVLNSNYPSAQQNYNESQKRVHDILQGLASWEFTCYPTRHIYKRYD